MATALLLSLSIVAGGTQILFVSIAFFLVVVGVMAVTIITRGRILALLVIVM